MQKKKAIEWLVYIVTGFIGLVGHRFFFLVQENVYTGPNKLAFLNNLLGNQTIATSFFVVLGALCMCCQITVVVEPKEKSLRWLRFIGIHVGLLIYIAYELWQKAHPMYQDWHEGDILVACMAYLIVLVIWVWLYLTKDNE